MIDMLWYWQAKAQCVIKHFPTQRSLYNAIHDPRLTVQQRESLLADKMGDKVCI